MNDTRKVRKLEESKNEVKVLVPKRTVSLSDLPWDTINIIIKFSQQSDYKLFRLNKTFTRLINKRRKGLNFKLAEISPAIFFSLLRQTQQQLVFLKIATNLKYIKKTAFDD